MAAALYTDSQRASALAHLDRRDEWRFFWRGDTRYVAMLSGRSNRLYIVRADAGSCSCPWNEKMWQRCAHMLAVELDATEDELREAAEEATAVREAETELAFMSLATRKRGDHAGAAILKRYESIWTED